jgi:hypothetical protein
VWYYNENSLANPSTLKICFKILTQVQIKSTVSKDKMVEIANEIRKNGFQVIVSGNNRPVKQFWIYADSLTRQIYMMMQHSNRPFLMTLPSFQGNFAGVFRTNKRFWRDNSLIHVTPQQIVSIKVEQPSAPEKSFELVVSKPSKYTLTQLSTQTFMQFKTEAIEAYLLCFKYLKVEGYEDNSDSIINIIKGKKPLYKIEITDNTGKKIKLENYQIERRKKNVGNPKLDIELNYCYLLVNEQEVAIVKYIETDMITRDIDYFTK